MSMWKTVTVLIGIAVLALAAAQTRGTGGEASAAAEECGACHQGKRSLAGRDSDALAAAIRAIRDGKVKHPPLELDDTSDEALAELAAELAAAE